MAAQTQSVRVLIVDDQASVRTAARMVIESTDGFEVAGEAATGEDGISLAGELTPDLVLMDINMPGMNGLEATRVIASGAGPERIIILSTYDAGEYEQLALDAGAVAFISKSDFGPDALTAAWAASA